jgi:crotonobetainyl-CoA:carnitine CoA-transferase CaiB-like acyl-CoA transferase
VRILDFSWFLASVGATRFLAALGADVLKVEWKTHPDSGRGSLVPEGGRDARATAVGPLPALKDPSVGGQFNNKNPGKRGPSLNVADPRGLAIAKSSLAHCDVVAEGFSPGVLTPPHLGGRPDRAAPLHGEDNTAILTGLLGMSEEEVSELTEQGVL